MGYQGNKFEREFNHPSLEYVWPISNEYDSIVEAQKKASNVGINCQIVDEPAEFGQWLDWGFFRIKGFKKGTLHLEFKDEQQWAMLNQRYAKIKGQQLPESFGKNTKTNESKKNKKRTSMRVL